MYMLFVRIFLWWWESCFPLKCDTELPWTFIWCSTLWMHWKDIRSAGTLWNDFNSFPSSNAVCDIDPFRRLNGSFQGNCYLTIVTVCCLRKTNNLQSSAVCCGCHNRCAWSLMYACHTEMIQRCWKLGHYVSPRPPPSFHAHSTA